MEKNDHEPVPDPVQKTPVNVPIPPTWPNKEANLFREKVERTSADLQLLISRVSQLEGGLTSALGCIRQINTDQEKDYGHSLTMVMKLAQLQSNLKLTIQAVEKLAKGKSLGALGLPGEEEWKETK
jgi:hypothetical protein